MLSLFLTPLFSFQPKSNVTIAFLSIKMIRNFGQDRARELIDRETAVGFLVKTALKTRKENTYHRVYH